MSSNIYILSYLTVSISPLLTESQVTCILRYLTATNALLPYLCMMPIVSCASMAEYLPVTSAQPSHSCIHVNAALKCTRFSDDLYCHVLLKFLSHQHERADKTRNYAGGREGSREG